MNAEGLNIKHYHSNVKELQRQLLRTVRSLTVGESGLVGEGVVVRIGRFPVQTPLGARPGFGTQPRYEAPGDPRVENVKRSD